MATVIQIKRSAASTAPTAGALSEAEMAYAQDKANDGASAILYIESVNNANEAVVHKIGGKYYTDLMDGATSAKTNNAIVKRDGAGAIAADVTGNVTGDLTGNADTASAWATARTITLAGDLSGSVSIDGSGDVTLTGTVSGADATTLTGTGLAANGTEVLNTGTDGTDATFTGDVTGDLTGNADTATALATARTVGGVSFDGSSNIDLPGVNTAGNQDTSGNAATATALETARAISVSGDATGTVNFDGTAAADIAMTLADSGVTAGTTGSATAVPVITVDAKGRVTAVSSQAIATSFDITDGVTTDTVNGGETLTFEGVANETDVVVSGNKVTVGMVTNPTIGGNLTVSGDLTVSGTTTTVNSDQVTLKDSLLKYADANVGDSVDVGFFGETNSDATSKFHGLFRDANDGKFKMFKDLETAPTTTVDTAGTGYAVATLIANIEGAVTGDVTGNVTGDVTGDLTGNVIGNVTGNVTGNLTGDVTGSLSGGTVSGLSAAIAVADGGTGAGTFTSNGIVYGNGTGAMQATAAGTDGYILYSNNGTPDWTNTLDGGSY